MRKKGSGNEIVVKYCEQHCGTGGFEFIPDDGGSGGMFTRFPLPLRFAPFYPSTPPLTYDKTYASAGCGGGTSAPEL